MKCQTSKKKKKEKDKEQTGQSLLGLFHADSCFPVRRSVLASDSCLSRLSSLRVWLLSANPFNLWTLRLELASRPGRALRALFRRGLCQVRREGLTQWGVTPALEEATPRA